jgi:7,8-dihydropterin-6-yl-methyl-4-(beta-D-ribofuranosyl)aminobenzene 5'-phosphate synthase
MYRHISLCALLVSVLVLTSIGAAETPDRVTILYDSFGKNPALTMDWGFAALIEYGGKRILFDTGNSAKIFEHNVKAAGADLRNLDFVVISHRHADHTSGITYLLTVNPKVRIYVPDEPWGLFARGVGNDSYRKDPSLPAEMRYYGGHPPEILEAGTPWPGGNFTPVSQKTEVAPGVFILPGVSTSAGTLELKELSLAIKSPQGLILIVGCSHPGVEHILQDAAAIDPHINILFGGMHQIQKPDAEVELIAAVLHDQYKLERVAPGHCTGEPEFAALKRAFGDHYVYAGVGTVIELPGQKISSASMASRNERGLTAPVDDVGPRLSCQTSEEPAFTTLKKDWRPLILYSARNDFDFQ